MLALNEYYFQLQAETEAVKTQASGGATSIQLKIWKGTQAQYDAIVTKDDNTFYIIVE